MYGILDFDIEMICQIFEIDIRMMCEWMMNKLSVGCVLFFRAGDLYEKLVFLNFYVVSVEVWFFHGSDYKTYTDIGMFCDATAIFFTNMSVSADFVLFVIKI